MDQQREGGSEPILKFVDLLEITQDLMPGDAQARIEVLFPSVVSRSHMKLLGTYRNSRNVGARILIGIAPTYSVSDLELLDTLESKLSSSSSNEDQIELFDVSTAKSISDLTRHFPGLGKMYQTPVIACWENGVWSHTASGSSAKEWLSNRYGLSLT